MASAAIFESFLERPQAEIFRRIFENPDTTQAGPRGPTGGGGPPHIPQQTPWPATQPVVRAATPRGQPRRRSGCRPQKPKTSVRKLMSVIGCTENSHLPDECARCAARPRGLARGATVPRRCQTHQSALRHSCGGEARPIAIIANSQD